MGADGILVRGRRECDLRSDDASKTGIMKAHNHKLGKRSGKMGFFAFFMLAMWMQARTAQGSMRIALTSHFSDREDCHRGFQVKFDDFDLGSALRQIMDLPPEWTERFLSHLKVGAYPPSEVTRHCSLNGENFTSVADMGYYVCHNAINIEQEVKLRALTGSFKDEDMDRIYRLLMEGKYLKAVMLVQKTLGIEVPDRVWEVMEQVGSRLERGDIKYIPKFIGDPKVIQNIPAFLNAVGKIESDDALTLKNTIKKFDPESMAQMDKLTVKLNTSFFEMIVNPSKMIELFKNPELTETVQKVRELMPVLDETDLNAMIKVQNIIRDTKGAGYVMKILLTLPINFVQKFTDVQLSASDVSEISSPRGILDDPRIKGAVSVVHELGILKELHNPFKALSKCMGDSLSVLCRDTSEKLCLELESKGCHLVADVY